MSTASPRSSPDPLNRTSTPLIDRVAPGWGDVILLLGRILIGGIFIQSGFDKLMGLDAFAAGLAARGLPAALVPVLALMGASVERPRHRLWADDALRRAADDCLRDRRDADLAPLLGVSGRGATHPDGAVCQERGDHRRLLISLRHRRRPLQPGSLVAQQQIARATRSCRRAA